MSRLPPFHKNAPKMPKRGIPLEARHVALCLIVCVPTCTAVCLVVDKLFGG